MSVVQDTLACGPEGERVVSNQPTPKSAAMKRSDHILYRDFLAQCMLHTFRKIDETESVHEHVLHSEVQGPHALSQQYEDLASTCILALWASHV